MYEEWGSTLPGVVLWQRRSTDAASPLPVAPDGCMDVIWVAGELLVAGPDTTPNYGPVRPDATFVGLRFPPGLGPSFFGMPAHELRDARVPLATLWSARSERQLVDRLADTAQPHRVLEEVAARTLRDAPPADPVTDAVRVRAAAGRPVAAIAAELGLSERQLHRRCLPAFGYGAKTLARILRMRRAVDLARRGTPLAAVAATAGYADQAHLSREVRALNGASLSTLLGFPSRAQPGSGANRSTWLPSGSSTTA